MKARAFMIVDGVKRRAREIGMASVLLCGAALFLQQVNQHYALEDWLFFRYAAYWLLCGLFVISCLSAGHALLVRLLGRTLPLQEHFTLSFALGVLAFAVGWFLLGVLQLYSSITFFVWPALLLLFGARASWRFLRRLRRRVRDFAPQRAGFPRVFEMLLLGFGVIALLMVYAPVLSPEGIAYDARWYHLALAERYAMTGGISRFGEGWFAGANPQLASYLYTWAFSLPHKALFDQVELAAHLEFTLFLATLAGIPPLVRRLLRGQTRARASWLAMLAFPGLYLYDSSLVAGADHIAAFWAVPIFLSLLRAWSDLDRRFVVLCGLMVAGPLLTKYTALGLVIFPSLAIAVRGAILQVRSLRSSGPLTGRPWLAVLLFGLTVLVATAPHWLKNAIFYGNPVYPLAARWFPNRPWTVDTPDGFWAFMGSEWSAERSWAGVLATLKALATFSFVPNDWPAFHRDVPVFGSLFTLSVPCLLFLKRPWRVVSLYVAVHIAIFGWYWLFHQDRYLQAFLPWMAAGVAAVAIRAWQLGWPARVAVVCLCSAQVVWGGDVPFIPGHTMLGGTPLTNVIQLMSSGYRGAAKGRFSEFGDTGRVRGLLPRGATLLIHEDHLQLGVGVATVSDWGPWQGGISYGQAPAPFEVYDLYKSLGVTHLMWIPRTVKGTDSMAGDLAFHWFVNRYVVESRSLGGHMLAQMPRARPPTQDFHDRVLILDCSPNSYAAGLYRFRDLKVTVLRDPRPASDFPKPLEAVDVHTDLSVYALQLDAVAHNPACFPGVKPGGLGVTQVAQRGALALWVDTGQGSKAR